MGDRAQIIIRRANTDIHLYTHWNGSELPATLAKGLAAGQSRWGDDSYLTRILFCTMLSPNDLRETTGYGISTQYQDSCPRTDLIVDTDNYNVHYMDKVWGFSEFIALAPTSFKSLNT